MNKIFYFLFLCTLVSCGGDEEGIVINQGGNQESSLSFTQATALLLESDLSLNLNLSLSKASPSNGVLTIQASNISAEYGTDYTTEPEMVNNQLTLDITKGQTQLGFKINAIQDADFDTELITFSLIAIEGEKLVIGLINELDLSIVDETIVNEKYQNCIPPLSDNQLTVATWNIEQFPKSDNVTIDLVEEIIENLNVDIIAVQEISGSSGRSAFTTLVSRLEGYDGAYFDVSNGLELGYIYKTSEITSFSNLSIIYPNESSAFPREPVIATATHNNGLEVTLINLHLKCCGDSEARRESASILLKDYIDQNLATENVIILGDFNDDIGNGSPFNNFIQDQNNYFFADSDIANGSVANWSYPSWPSHLDHILITNELEDNLLSVETIKLENCLPEYSSSVSDHRPVIATFGN